MGFSRGSGRTSSHGPFLRRYLPGNRAVCQRTSGAVAADRVLLVSIVKYEKKL